MAEPRFYLEELTEEKHLAAVHELFSDPANIEGLGMAPYPSLESNRAWIRRRTRAADPAIENFAVMAPASSPLHGLMPTAPASEPAPAARLVGLVGVIRLHPPEAGYVVAKACQGHGVASEALAAMMRLYWAAQPATPAVEAYIDADNVASEKVARRAGFLRAPARTVLPGGALPNGDEVDCEVGVWVCERPPPGASP